MDTRLRILISAMELFGEKGLETATMPPLNQLTGNRLGYFIREGKHSMTPADWKVFMDFADKQWRSGHSADEK